MIQTATFSRNRTLPRSHMLTGLAAAIAAVAALDVPTPVKLGCLAAAILIVTFAGVTAAVSLVCLALPVTMIQVTIGETEWGGLEIALIACWVATGVAVLGALVGDRSARTLRDFATPVDLMALAAVLSAIGALTLFWIADGGSRADAVREYRRVILEPLILIPAIAFVRKRGETRQLLPWLVVPAIVVALLAMAQIALQTSVVEIGSIARPIGTFTHPNNLAFYLARTVWFAPLVFVSPRIAWGSLKWIAAAVIAAGCMLTLSRGALLGLAVGGMIFFWEVVRPNWRWYLSGAIGIGLVAIASRAVLGEGDSTHNRIRIWQSALNMVRDHPIRGVGLDQFLAQYGRRYVEPEGWPERYTSHPHNIVLDSWLRLGLAGLVVLWAMFELTVRRVRVALRGPAMTVQRAAVAMLVAGFTHGLIDNSFFLADLACFTWLGLALATSHSTGVADGD